MHGPKPPIVTQVGGPTGYMFLSEDERRIVQARQDGFSFNRLKPYSRWEDLREEARKQWAQYVSVAHPDRVTRLALRYINRLEIPLPFNEFKEYVLTFPELAAGIPQGMATYFMRLVIPDPKTKATAIITQTIEPVVHGSNMLPLIFDIDVFFDSDFTPASKDIWDKFEELRKFKNVCFKRSITDKAKELFA